MIESEIIEKPNVAVLMSIYSEDTPFQIYLSIKSLLTQTYKMLHIFIMVDGPIKKNCRNLLAIYERNKQCSVFFNAENRGLAVSLNALIDIILQNNPEIQFFSRMDADDICHLTRIDKQISFMNSFGKIDVLGSACIEFGVYNKIITKPETDVELKKKIIKTTPFIHPSVTFRRGVFEKGFRYPVNTSLTEDLSFWFELALNGLIFHNLQSPLIYYRLTNKTLARRTGFTKAISELNVRLKYLLDARSINISNIIYCLAHFILRTLPFRIVKLIYHFLR